MTVKLSSNGTKHSGVYELVAEFSNGDRQTYWGLPSKIAGLLTTKGYKMNKINYFTYEGTM